MSNICKVCNSILDDYDLDGVCKACKQDSTESLTTQYDKLFEELKAELGTDYFLGKLNSLLEVERKLTLLSEEDK